MMARTLKDILKVVSSRVNSNEFSAALSASNPFEAELDDKTFSDIETQIKGLTTLEEAKNNPEIFEALKPKVERIVDLELRKKYKAEALHGVETELNKMAGKLGVQVEGKKWHEMVGEITSKADQITGDVDGKVSAQAQEIERLHKKVANLQEARKTEKTEFEEKFTNFQIDTKLRDEIETAIPLAAPYQEKRVKEGLITEFMNLAKQKAAIRLENGSLKFLNPDNPELELFNEDKSTKAGLSDLIGEDAQPYIATAPKPGERTTPKTPTAESKDTGYAPGSAADAMARQRQRLNMQIE